MDSHRKSHDALPGAVDLMAGQWHTMESLRAENERLRAKAEAVVVASSRSTAMGWRRLACGHDAAS